MNYFEKWRIEMGELTNFYLIGHSFGGYMMGNYASRHHQHIKRLILSSSIGIIERPKDYNHKKDLKGMVDAKTGKKY